MDNKPYCNPQGVPGNQQMPPNNNFTNQQGNFNPANYNNQQNPPQNQYNNMGNQFNSSPNYNGGYNAPFNPNFNSDKTGVPYNSQPPHQSSPYQSQSFTPPAAPYFTPPTTQVNNPNLYNNQGFNNGPAMSPSAVYNSQNEQANQQNGAPQYHYGNPTNSSFFNNEYYKEHQRKMKIRKAHEKQLRRNGNISGAVLLGSLLISSMFSLIFLIPKASEIFQSGVAGSSIFNMLYTLLAVGGSFLIFGKLYAFDKEPSELNYNEPIKQSEYPISFSAPKNKLRTLLIVLISFGGCMVANFISSLIIGVLENFGIYSTYSALQDPENAVDIILMCLATAVLPPLIEEFAMRGIVLSHLRKYGAPFAILASAFMFAIFHGSVAQIPFAFICGLFLGYSVIATGSIWPAIIVHALNNSLSCISSILFATFDESVGNLFFSISAFIVVLAGTIALFFYFKLYKPYDCLRDEGEATALTTGQKFGKFLSSPGMIIAIVLFVIQALTTLSTTPPAV